MAIEAERGCGFRKVGGLYLCGEGGSHSFCDRLPYELKVCPTCGEGIKFSRGWRWLNWKKYAGVHEECECPIVYCPVCIPGDKPYGLLFIGESFYTPRNFIEESMRMGVSRRIPAAPKGLKLGETWVLCAHIRACGERQSEEPPFKIEPVTGVFYAFRPQRLEFLIWESQAVPECLAELVKKNYTPIIIPDGDPDHDPKTSLKPTTAERDKVVFEGMRQRLGAGVS